MISIFKKKKQVKIEPELDCYLDLEISLWRWNQYQMTSDYNWFRKDFDGRQPKIQSKYLEEVEISLNDQYFELVADEKYKSLLEKRLKVAKLITRHTKIAVICDRIKLGFETNDMQSRLDYILLLEKEGFKIPQINSEEGDIEEVDKVMYQCEQIKNQIHILSKDLQQKGSENKSSVEKQLIMLCLALEMKLVKTKDISVSEFIELNKILQERNEMQKQALEKSKVK